jgi:hypothetical protein
VLIAEAGEALNEGAGTEIGATGDDQPGGFAGSMGIDDIDGIWHVGTSC